VSWICLEYQCPAGHRAASLEDRADPPASKPCDTCNALAERVISAPRIKIPLSSVTTTGRSTSERPPGVPDTSLLADGMPMREWRAKHTPAPERDDDLERYARRVKNMPDSRVHEL
jgi:hypothetical protein